MEFSQPPPMNLDHPPPMSNFSSGMRPPYQGHQGGGGHYQGHHHNNSRPGFYKGYNNHFNKHGGPGGIQDDFDGKRLRKSVMRKTVDYNSSIVKALENRVWQRDHRDRRALQPESSYIPDLLPPSSYLDNPSNALTTRFVKTATNKMRCPIFTLAWTPEGRRLITGASSGEFTLWNGLTFNFETILQAHDVPVRTMVWSHNDNWMVTGDHNGYVKYWQSNMNNVKMFQAHKEPIRGISFCPTDSKFASCSDDGTVRVIDFQRCQEERVLRGHGADVKCVHWHPQKALIVSGSKDNQQPIKLWDPKSGQALATLHAHKSTVMDLKWNNNGNWLITASRDHLLKLFDLRNLKEEIQVFRGHKKEASSVSWHPVHEGLFCSGGSDGQILFWNVGIDKEIGGIEAAHESIVWTLAWHPLGHILCSGSNDHTVKFWTRNRPGDGMRDKYNLNTLPASMAGMEDYELDDHNIPGMGPEDKIDLTTGLSIGEEEGNIPGLDLDTSSLNDKKGLEKKVPYSKPIPKNFQAQWSAHEAPKVEEGTEFQGPAIYYPPLNYSEILTKLIEGLPGTMILDKLEPTGMIVYGKVLQVEPGSKLATKILEGSAALTEYIHSGAIPELEEVLPHQEIEPYMLEDFLEDYALNNVGDEEDGEDDAEKSLVEPETKRVKYDFENMKNDGVNVDASRDWETKMQQLSQQNNHNSHSGNNPGIPSLLNMSIEPPKPGQISKDIASPWESAPFPNNNNFPPNGPPNGQFNPNNPQNRNMGNMNNMNNMVRGRMNDNNFNNRNRDRWGDRNNQQQGQQGPPPRWVQNNRR